LLDATLTLGDYDFKAVLFDVDDTLFDRKRAQLLVLDVTLHELDGLFAGLDKEILIDAFRESDRVTLQELYEDNPAADNFRVRRAQVFLGLLGLDEGHASTVAEIYVRAYPTMNAPIDGAQAVVMALAPKFQLGVVSNGIPDVQYRKLETLELRQHFDCIVLSEELGIRKPDPRIFWHATGLLGREPEECLYVGDSYTADVVGAKEAGLPVCWFNPAGLHPAQVGVESDDEIRALDEILEILEEADNDI
jgi:HAD superfamily hydrolase (TIGR01509 family)